MNPIRPDEILDLGDYERARDQLRRRAIDARALRRVPLGPNASLAFENRETVRYQIQEMLRSERIARPQDVAHELETYSELLPGRAELSATLMLEFPTPEERAVRLAELVGLERHVRLVIGDRPPVPARFDERQLDPERVSAVQFLRFPLSDEHVGALAREPVKLVVDHPRYHHAATLAPATALALRDDLGSA